MPSIRERLLSAVDDFCSALSEGDDAVSVFNSGWESLLDEVNTACDAAALDTETITLAYTTALRIATLADTSIELYTSYETFTAGLMDDLNSLMMELNLDHSPKTPAFPPSSANKRTSPSTSFPKTYLPDASFTCGSLHRKRLRDHHEDLEETSLHSAKRCRSSPFPRTLEPTLIVTSPTVASATSGPGVVPQEYRALPSRKRRLSESEATPSSRPYKYHVGPRLHAVSESYANSPSRNPTCAVRRPAECGPQQRPRLPCSSIPSEEISGVDILPLITTSGVIHAPTTPALDFPPAYALPDDWASPYNFTPLTSFVDDLDAFLDPMFAPVTHLSCPAPPSPCQFIRGSTSPEPSSDASSSGSYSSPATPSSCVASRDLPSYSFEALLEGAQNASLWDDHVKPLSAGDVFVSHGGDTKEDPAFSKHLYGLSPDWDSLFQTCQPLSTMLTPMLDLSALVDEHISSKQLPPNLMADCIPQAGFPCDIS